MTRTKPSLQRHLLTRSDLARLEVPAGEVTSWLANGWLEQIGELPDGEAGDDVFTVPAEPLRQELQQRLQEMGKTPVVLDPLRVRTFLHRAMLARPAAGAEAEEVRRLAAEEALPATAGDAAIDGADTEDLTQELESCFDADDLADALADHRTPDTIMASTSSPSAFAAADAATATATATAPDPAPGDHAPVPAAAASAQTLERFEGLLGQLHAKVTEVAERSTAATTPPPLPAAIDVAPLVQAVHAGFEHAAGSTAAMNTALAALGDRVDAVGSRVERSLGEVARSLRAHDRSDAREGRAAPPIVVAGVHRPPMVLVAVSTLVAAWSIVFWVKTGSAQLALGTLVAGNLIACCLLACRRTRGD